MKGTFILILFLVLTSSIISCITPYTDNSAFKESIVIQGSITDQPGPYMISISKTLPLKNQANTPNAPVSGASVTITDDLGNSEVLIEKSSGFYYTTSMQGVVGRSYFLTATLGDGSTYKSTMETLTPVGNFSNLRPELHLVTSDSVVTNTLNRFDIYLDSDVLPEQENRVWWRFTGTYQIQTHPELKIEVIKLRGPAIILMEPFACSGYTATNKPVSLPDILPHSYAPLLTYKFPCTCCTCWITEYGETPLISDPNFITNGKITGQYVGSIEINRRTFYQKYHLQIDQMSLSENVYSFWKNVKIAQQNSSNLFQTPPPKAIGNITATSPGATPVLGYFAASSVKSLTLTLSPADLPYNFLHPIDTIVDNCSFRNSTLNKPVFW